MNSPRVIRLQDGDSISDQILAASRERAVLDCRRDGARVRIGADDIRNACAAERADERDPYGLRIANAAVEGQLDLSAFQLGEPLHFLGCTFNQAAVFESADLHELVFTGGPEAFEGFGRWERCQLPGLLANGVRVRRDLVLSGSHITGKHHTLASVRRSAAIWLSEATIGGRLLAAGTQILTHADRAIQADRTSFGGAVRLVDGFRANAEIRLIGASLGGSLDLTGATLEPHNGRALDLAESTIGSLFLIDDPVSGRQLSVQGRIELGHMTIRGRVLIRGAVLRAPNPGVGRQHYSDAEESVAVAIDGPGVTIQGRLLMEKSVSIHGAVLLPGSTLAGGIRLDDASLINPGSLALDLSQSKISSGISMVGSVVHGLVNLVDANVLGSLDLHEAILQFPAERSCLVGVGLRVSGDLNLRHMLSVGGKINFRSAVIDGVVDAEGATLVNEGAKTLSLHQARVGGNVRLCGGFSSKGQVVLNRAVVEGRLRCDGGSFSWTSLRSPEWNLRGSAFEAISANIRSGIGLGWTVDSGAIDFTDTKTAYLADNPETDWPYSAHLSGFAYERFGPLDMTQGEGVWNSNARVKWLTRVSRRDPRPWEHAASVLRSNGDLAGAEGLLIAHKKLARHQGGVRWFAKLVDRLKNATVGYGYRPQRAMYWLGGLLIAVTVGLLPAASHQLLRASDAAGFVFSPSGLVEGQTPKSTAAGQNADLTPISPTAPVGPCGGGRVRCFDPVLFAVDTVVPIIDLKQRSTWYPSHTGAGILLDWILNLCTLLGWVLSTVFALSLARPVRGI